MVTDKEAIEIIAGYIAQIQNVILILEDVNSRTLETLIDETDVELDRLYEEVTRVGCGYWSNERY